MAETSILPKDVGLCVSCSTPNSKHATKCRSCNAVLPWAEKKAAKAAPLATPKAQSGPPPGTLARPKRSVGDTLGNVHWGGTIIFVLLCLGVFLLSVVHPFWGFKMQKYFSEEENNLSYAASAGLAVLFFGIMGAMIFFGNGGGK